MKHHLVSFGLACAALPDVDAAAQQQPALSTEATFGFRVGRGGTYVNRGGAALDVLVGARLRDTPAGALVGGFTVGAQTPVTSSLECLIVGTSGECAPDFPTLLSTGALLGVQRGRTQGPSVRILGGPMFYHAFGGDSALGVQARVDVATPPVLGTALTASLRTAALPAFRGEALGITEFGIGLRIP